MPIENMNPTAVSSTESLSETVHYDEREAHHTRTVVISVDFSEHSKFTFDWALENIAKKETDLLVFLNCRPISTVPGPYGTSYIDFTDYLHQVELQNRTESHAMLQKYAGAAKLKGFTVKAVALRGDPRDELTRKIKEIHADLVVMGSRGHGAIKRAFLGSVSGMFLFFS